MPDTLTIDTAWVRGLSAHGAIVLGYLVRQREDADEDGWFTAPLEAFRDATGMQIKTYLNWRDIFRKKGILEIETPVSGASRYRLLLPEDEKK